jgi:two-component system sensor histidine kinase/response regulator
MVTAHRRQELVKGAQQLGIHHVLPKPVNSSQLINTMMQLLGIDGPVSDSAPSLADNVLEMQLGTIQGARILLVEDNEINQLVACEMLRDVGFKVDVAHNGRLAVEQVRTQHERQRPYDIVLMDMQMPVMDGVTAARLIREHLSAQELPIVAMTANAMEADRRRCLQAGMNGFVTKPIKADELWLALLQWVKQRDGLGSPARPAPVVESINPTRAQQAARALLASLRAVPDLDVNIGLTRTANKPNFYASMLRKFVQSQGDAVQRIRQRLADSDTPTATLLAHTLKGLAGNLGALRLYESAGVLEELLGTAPDPLQLEQALAATDALLQALVQALHQTPGFAEYPVVIPYGALSTLDRHTAGQVVHKIRTCLMDNNANALELWDTHVGILRPLLAQWSQIETAIGAFEFESALELLNQDTP